MLNKKAAMFGLDARIALAIFGALSVISGAALYSAIQDAKVTSLLADMNEMGKAYEQYYLDTGTDLVSHDTVNLRSKDLVVNPTVTGWQGPYINYAVSAVDANVLFYPKITTGLIYFTRFKTGDFVSTTVTSGVCTDVKECDLYVSIREPLAEKYLQNLGPKLSNKVDGNSNLLIGNIRATQNATYYYLYLKYMPAQSL